MAQVLKAGNIKVDIEANAKGLVRGFREAIESLRQFGQEEEKVTSRGKRLEDQLADLERRKKTLGKQLDATKEKYGENSVQVDKLKDRIANLSDRIETQKFRIGEYNDKMGQTPSFLEKAGGAMKWLAGTAQVAIGNMVADAFSRATTIISNFAGSVFDAAVQTEQQGVAFRVLTGGLENSSKLMRDINELAVKTPFDIAEIRDLTKQMLSFGFSQEEVIPTMKMLGDITAGTGGDLTLLARAFGQVKTKGKLYAQELNQLGEQGLAVREMLAETMGISVSDLMVGMETKDITVEFEEFAAILEKLHKDKFFNLMGEQAETAGGRMQNLREQLLLTGEEILGIDTETGLVVEGGLFDRISEGLARNIQFLSDNKETIITVGQKVIDFFLNFTEKLTEISNSEMSPALMELFDVFKESYEDGSLQRFIEALLHTIGLFVKIYALHIKYIYIPIYKMIIAFFEFGYAISIFFQQIVAWFSQGFKGMAMDIAYWWGYALGTVVKILGMVIMAGINFLIDFGLFVWNTIWAIIGYIGEMKTKAILFVVDMIFGMIAAIVGFVMSIPGIINKIYDFWFSVFHRTGQFIIDFAKNPVATFEDMKRKLFLIGLNIGLELISNLNKFVNWLKDINFSQIASDMWNGLYNSLVDYFSGIGQLGVDLANQFGQGFKDALGISSPSKVMIEAGLDITEGLDIGIEKGTFDVEKRVSIMADTMIDDVDNKKPKPKRGGGLTINQYGATISTSWIPSYAR